MLGFDSRFQKAALLLCIVFSVISAVIFAYQVYAFATKGSAPAPPNDAPTRPQPPDDLFRGVSRDSPVFLFYSFIGIVTSALSAVAIYRSIILKEKDGVKQTVTIVKVQPDGKRLVKLLQDNKGTLTQSELVRKSGMDKLRVSRALRRLEKLNVVRKHPYGMTNNITLEQGKQVD